MRFIITLVMLVGFAFGCGASARTKALQTGHVALNAARDMTLEVSRTREKQIVDACNPPTCTLEEGHRQLMAWRMRVDVVVIRMGAAYRLLAAAALAKDAKSADAALLAIKLAVDEARGLK